MKIGSASSVKFDLFTYSAHIAQGLLEKRTGKKYLILHFLFDNHYVYFSVDLLIRYLHESLHQGPIEQSRLEVLKFQTKLFTQI